MACTGSHCDNHGTGTTTCDQHRPTCDTNRPLSLSGDFGVPGALIRASDIENLRANIRDELARWDLKYDGYTYYQSSAYYSGLGIDDVQADQLDNMIGQVIGGASDYPEGGLVEDTNWTNIRDRYNTMRTSCICNSDCACNLVCSCHNNCDCNYSDERLKENIAYVRTRRGINWYSFNYVWDKNKTHIGVLAQELLNTRYERAVSKDKDGYYMVDYSRIPN